MIVAITYLFNLLQKSSHVQISNVLYKNIRGSSASEYGVSLNCSMEMPCQNVTVEDIDLHSVGRQPLKSFCSNVKGSSLGKHNPPSCVPSKNRFSVIPLLY